MKNIKGFTLIELLAVIVILAIIALIATPIILGIIDDARKSAKQRTSELVANGVQLAYTKYLFKNNGSGSPDDFCEQYMKKGSTYFEMDKGTLENCEGTAATVKVGNDTYTITYTNSTKKASVQGPNGTEPVEVNLGSVAAGA